MKELHNVRANVEYLLSLSAESWRADHGTALSCIDLSLCALLLVSFS